MQAVSTTKSTSNPSEAGQGMPHMPRTTTTQVEEIDRRTTVARQMRDCDERSTFERVEDEMGVDPPFRSTEQRFVLFGLSHVEMPPIAKDPNDPGIRLFAMLPTMEDCREYATEVSEADPTCSLMICESHQWDIAAKTPKRYRDKEYKQNKCRRIAQAHAELRQRSGADFDANVANASTGGSDVPTEDTIVPDRAREARLVQHDRAWQRAQKVGKSAKTRLPGSLSIEGQKWMVIAFVKDVTPEVVAGEDDPEFAFMPLAAFDTEKDADRYVRNVASDHIQDHALDVVGMRKWLYPENVELEDKVSIVYRQSELTEVMQRKRQEATEVDRFKLEQDRLGEPVTVNDIEPDTDTPLVGGVQAQAEAARSGIAFEAELFGEEEHQRSLESNGDGDGPP